MAAHGSEISLSVSFEADCDLVPAIPQERVHLAATVVQHKKMGVVALARHPNGKLYANGKEVVRRISEAQKKGANVKARKLHEQWMCMETLNFALLMILIAHPDLIPEEWKVGHTYFWGTIFHDGTGKHYYVFSLFWDQEGAQWLPAYNEFSDMLEVDCYAALLAA